MRKPRFISVSVAAAASERPHTWPSNGRRGLVPNNGPRWLVAWLAALIVTVLGAASTASAATTSVEDPTVISDWNALAVTTFGADPTKAPQETPLYMGFVQAAVYDAVVGVEGGYEPYRFDARAPRGTSAQAAAVAAAHEVLATYSPYAQTRLDAAYAASLAQIPDGNAKTEGIAFGTLAAENLIAIRANDGRNAPVLFSQPPAPGVWRPTPPGVRSEVPAAGLVAGGGQRAGRRQLRGPGGASDVRRPRRPVRSPAVPRLPESPRCWLAARSVASCKRTSLSLTWRSGHQHRRPRRCSMGRRGAVS